MTLTAMPKYDTYKNSGVEWLGDIPEHWHVIRLKNAALINPISDISKVHLDDEICFLPMEKVGTDGTVEYDLRRSLRRVKQGFTSFQVNDVLIAKITPCFENGKGAYLKNMPTKFGYGSTEFHVLRAYENFEPAFLYYLSKSHGFMDLGEKMMTGSAGQKRVPTDFIAEFRFASPSFVEQKIIANFLDQKTTQIDEAIAIKEQQIALLNERKQILIQQAVTQGLDPNVPMKDSGVAWIGTIPAHWGIKRAKYLFNEINERSINGDEELLSVSHITGVTPRSEKNVNMFMAEDYSGSKTCKKNDLVINIMWAWMGALGVSDREGIVSPSYGVFREKTQNTFNPVFLEHLLKSKSYIEHYNQVSTGLHSSRLRFYGHMFFDMEMGFPSFEEQNSIIEYIQKESKNIDKALVLQEQQITMLKEYKTTLINSAVTGKIKVV
ncbi:restriction endonuclease subunit S [Aeromonas veronii]|uniref:restriction endonuclease subunit S n=1 Tax=Aeromonas veronii TaxID=654 RepID=UPI0031FD48BF